jgi:hypothetical protein
MYTQCNVIQCMHVIRNAMHAMQCMYGSPSVRTEWSQSVIFFFHFLKIQKWQNLVEAGFELRTLSQMEIWMYDGRTRMKPHFTPLANGNINVKCQYVLNVTDGQTSFSYFSLVSVQSHTVSKSVRTEVRSQKNVTDKTDKRKHRSDRSGHIQWQLI